MALFHERIPWESADRGVCEQNLTNVYGET